MTQISVVDSELNEWIHEKMLGYTRDFLKSDAPNIQVWIGEIPDYCGSLENALKVVEKVRELGMLVSIVNSLEGNWTVSILVWNAAPQSGWQPALSMTDESLPRAICQAVVSLTPDQK